MMLYLYLSIFSYPLGEFAFGNVHCDKSLLQVHTFEGINKGTLRTGMKYRARKQKYLFYFLKHSTFLFHLLSSPFVLFWDHTEHLLNKLIHDL